MQLHVPTILLVLISSTASAADWPQYRGPAWDGKSQETIGEVAWPKSGPKVIWKQPAALGFSSFAVAGGRAFTLVAEKNSKGALSQTVVALDAATGKEQWRYAMSRSKYQGGGDAGARDNQGGDGPRTTPTVDGDRVYVYDSKLKLACLNAVTGKLVWRHNIRKDFGGRNVTWDNAMAPVIDGDSLFIVGGGRGQSVLAFNKQTGEEIWKSGDEKMTHATPMLATIQSKRQLVCFLRPGLVAYDVSDGTELWRTAYPFNVSTAAMPVVVRDLVYCSAGYGVGAGLFRITPDLRVEDVWQKTNELMNHWSTPVLLDGHLYGIYGVKKYGKAPLQCVELATGQIKWKQAGYGPGNCILAGDKLVVLTDTGELTVVAATPASYQELARADVLEGKCWSTPALVDGRVYLRSTKEAACVEL